MVEIRHDRPCPACGYPNDPEDLNCAMCGDLLRARFHVSPRPAAPTAPTSPRPAPRPRAAALEPTPPTIAGLPEWAFWLAVGAPLALAFSSLSVWPLTFIGWFLGALVHELGHTVSALFFGSIAVPAIRLDGHAAAVHGAQSTIAVIFVWAGLGWCAWRFREERKWLAVFVVAAALYPAFAFTPLMGYVHLAAGHLGELVFATVFFWRALTGGFVKQTAERPLYSALGWFWMGGNVLLFGSLILSEESRRWYLTNGSFGLQNDFVRMANLLGTSLPVVAFPMLLLSLSPLPIAYWLFRRTPAASLHYFRVGNPWDV